MGTVQEEYETGCRHDSLGALLVQLADNAVALLQDEIDLLGQASLEKGHGIVRGAVTVGIWTSRRDALRRLPRPTVASH